MILVLFLFYPTFSLQQIKSLLPEYILTEDEQVILTLGHYFAGDILQYEISPSSSATLINPLSNLTYNYYYFTSNTSLPISTANMISLYPKTFLNQFLLYGTSTELLIFFINPEISYIMQGPSLAFEPFIQFQPIKSDQVQNVLILTQKLELFNLKIDYKEYIPLNMTINKLYLPLPSEEVYMSEGEISDYLLITGYDNSEAYAYFYNIKDITSPYFVNKIKISSGTPKILPPLLATTFNLDHYIVCATESKLIKFKLDNDSYIIENVLVLDVFLQNVTSIQPATYENNLILGIKGGFMVISFDFQQVYTKSGSKFYESVLVYSSGTRDVILTGNGNNYKIYELSDRYDIIQSANLVIEEKYFMWNFFTFSYLQHAFIYGINNGLTFVSLNFIDAMLKLNSSENSTELNLVVSQTFPNASISQSFVVRRPKNNEQGYIEKIGNSSVVASFKNFKSNVIVPLHNYVVGDNLTIEQYSLNVFSGNSFFSYKIEPIGNLKNAQSIYLDSGNYTSILTSNTDLIIYNSSGISVFINEKFYNSFESSQFYIIKILNCGLSLVIYYNSSYDPGYFLLLLRKVDYEKSDLIRLENECLSLECSSFLILCQNSSGIVLYEQEKFLINYVSFISNNNFCIPITSVSLAFSNYLIVVSDFTNIVVLDLEYYLISGKLKILVNETVSFEVIIVRTNIAYIYLFTGDNQVYMYDNQMNMLKKLTVLSSENSRLHNEYLVSVSDSELQIINTAQLITNSTIAIVSIPPSISFCATMNNSDLVVYLLYDSTIEVYQIPDNYNSLNLLTEIIDFNNIDEIEYQAELSVVVSNNISQEELNISLVLYVNGETIYKNSSGVEYIQKNYMKYQCGELKFIPMNSIFVGQGLSGEVVDTKYASLNKRFDQIKWNYTFFPFDIYLFSNNFNEYLAIYECNIFVLNKDFELITDYELANSSTNCSCYSGSILTDIDYIVFAIGCTVGESIIKEVDNINDYQYMLIFGIIHDSELVHLSNLTIAYPPQKLRVSSRVSGEFLLAFSENYEILETHSFYSNHLTLVQGYLDNSSIIINEIYFDYSGMFNLNNYYLTDFQLLYDPLFDMYYIYTLDYYFGLRIISMDFNNICTPSYTLHLQSPAYSLAVCGSILYIVMENTEIDQYLLKNWITPEFPSTIPTYSSEYFTIQGSLRCSSGNFAKYLIFQMKNTQEKIYLHVVDTLAKNMSNTVTDYFITQLSNDSTAYSEFLNNSGYLVIVNSSQWQIYLISDFQLVINTNYDCNKGDEQSFKIEVNNILNKKNSADFKITIDKYSQGHVKYGQIEIWQLALICIGAFLLLILLFLCIRKRCLKHKTKVKSNALFEFKNKFEEINSEYLNIKINQSSSSL